MSDDRDSIKRLCDPDSAASCITLRNGETHYAVPGYSCVYLIAGEDTFTAAWAVSHDHTKVLRTFPYHAIDEIVWA